MPRFRDLTVCVTDYNGNDLEEWGVQHLRSQKKASAYIQAATNMAFKVTIKPRLPFQDPDLSMAYHNDCRMDAQLELQAQEEPNDKVENPDLRGKLLHARATIEVANLSSDANGEMHAVWLTSNTLSATEDYHSIKKKELINNDSSNIAFNHRRQNSYNKFSDRHYRNPGPSNETTRHSSPIRSQAISNDSSPPPFHLLASLFLDGRKMPERKLVVYLDPDDEDFAYPDGKVTFKSRWVQRKDGSMKEHSWVFRDVGIETVFDKMLISGGENYGEILNEDDEDVLPAAMRATSLGVERNDEEEKNSIGQIRVVFERVVLGEKWQDNHYRSKHQEGEEAEDVDMAGMKREITHTTGLEHTGTRSSRPIRVVSYFPYRGREPYATFQFFYRSQETLETFNFPGFPRSNKFPARGRRHMEAAFANVTPLSIAYPLPLSKRKGRSFEENIKEVTSTEAEKNSKRKDTHPQLAAVKVNSHSLSKRKQSSSATSTMTLIKSSPTSPRKRHVEVFKASHQDDEQNSGYKNSSVRPIGFTAEQTSQVVLPTSGLSKGTVFSANGFSSNVLVSFSPDSSTQGMSSNFATKCLTTDTQEGPLKPSSSVLGIVDTKVTAELSKIPCGEYRGSGQASDADDERDESDVDTLIGHHENADIDRLNRDSVVPSPEKDDQGLHCKLRAMRLIQSEKRRSKEGINDDYYSESSATSPIKMAENTMEHPPSKLGLSPGTAEDADEEDNATKENRSPVEKAGQLLLHPRVKRAKL